jgi:hypothetical protein
MGDGIRYRVRAECESANPAGSGKVLADGLMTHVSDEKLTLGGHRRETGVDVIRRTGAAGEGKFPEGEGTLDEKRE